MTTQHTKKPWKVNSKKGRQTVFEITQNGRTLPIAMTYGEDSESNARLIAASPTLYDYVVRMAKQGDKEACLTLDSLQLVY